MTSHLPPDTNFYRSALIFPPLLFTFLFIKRCCNAGINWPNNYSGYTQPDMIYVEMLTPSTQGATVIGRPEPFHDILKAIPVT
jgi:hypothetical protein